MNKVLKADDIKVLLIASGTAYPKEVFEQMIVAFQRGAGWTDETTADIVITHCDTSGGQYVAFDTLTVDVPGAGAVGQVEVDLVAMKDYFKFTLEVDGGTPTELILDVIAVLADSRNVDTATSKELPDGTPRAVLSESFYNL